MITRLIILILCTTHAFAQPIVKGVVKNAEGQSLGFASVFIRGTQHGTTCNEHGFFELRCDTGKHDLIVQLVGHTQHVERVELQHNDVRKLEVVLREQTYSMNEVKITATAEDPAYPIMRQVIAHRAIYLKEAKSYQCKVYIKGMQRLTTIPKRVLLMKVPEDVKPGIVYLSESLSEYSFMQPNLVKERMISSKVSGDNRAFSFNRAGAIRFNVYENMLPSYGLNQRGFVSPIAANAFAYYKYKLEGESKENNYTIYKIKIIPRRNSDPVFRGHIYVVKDSWRIHSTDLVIDKGANIEFVDTLIVRQIYAPQKGGVWMPISQRFIFQLEILGFRGNGYFVALYSDYKVNSLYPPTFYQTETEKLDVNDPVPQLKKVPKVKPPVVKTKREKSNQAIETKPTDDSLKESDFNREVLSIDKQANQTNDSIWELYRPVPLTEEEQLDYTEKDSIEQVENSEWYLDSMDRINNRLDWLDPFIGGYTYAHSYKKTYYNFSPLLNQVQFNTVEGYVITPTFSKTKEFEDERSYSIQPNLRYGFASKQLLGQLIINYTYNPYHRARWRVAGGYYVQQFNNEDPISPALNSYYSLMQEQNFMKLYRELYASASWSREVLNGLQLDVGVKYAQREPISNQTNEVWRNQQERVFTSNTPIYYELLQTSFSTHQAFILHADAEVKFAQRYISRPNRKIRFASKYPTLLIGFKAGLPMLGSDVSFLKADIGTQMRKSFKLLGVSYLKFHSGIFINRSRLYFMDFHHFNGNQTLFALNGYDAFQLLDYYLWSTSKQYIELKYNHHFNGFWLNKLPLIRKLKWQEVATVNYFKTPDSPQYLELGAGIEHIFKFFRVDYFQSFANGNYLQQGIRIGFGF